MLAMAHLSLRRLYWTSSAGAWASAVSSAATKNDGPMSGTATWTGMVARRRPAHVLAETIHQCLGARALHVPPPTGPRPVVRRWCRCCRRAGASLSRAPRSMAPAGIRAGRRQAWARPEARRVVDDQPGARDGEIDGGQLDAGLSFVGPRRRALEVHELDGEGWRRFAGASFEQRQQVAAVGRDARADGPARQRRAPEHRLRRAASARETRAGCCGRRSVRGRASCRLPRRAPRSALLRRWRRAPPAACIARP